MVLKSPHCLSQKNYENYKNQILEKLKKYLEIQPTNKNIQETRRERNKTNQKNKNKNFNNADLCENSHRQDDHSGGGGE
jgi:hypothetical protein